MTKENDDKAAAERATAKALEAIRNKVEADRAAEEQQRGEQ